MAIIVHARGHKAGVTTSGWYQFHHAMRCKDPVLARRVAGYAVALANSDIVWYENSTRHTLGNKLAKYGYDVAKYIRSGETSYTDCSAFVQQCYSVEYSSLRGYPYSSGSYSVSAFGSSRFYSCGTSYSDARTGDILYSTASELGHNMGHVAMVASTSVDTYTPLGGTDCEIVHDDGLEDTVDSDGNWYYYKDNKVLTSYTGFAKNKNGWWYLTGGKVNFNITDVIKDTKSQTAYPGAWWYVKNGQVTFTTTVAKNSNGWWYINNGKVDFTYTGIAKNENGWWRIVKGKVDFTCHSIEKNQYGWWYIENGQVDFTYNGFWYNSNGCWYVKDGKVDFSITSVIKDVKGNCVYNKATKKFGTKGIWWYVKNNQVMFSANTVAKNANGWWKITNGQVDFDFNGVGTNENGSWYIVDGKVDFTHNGAEIIDGQYYKFEDGKVVSSGGTSIVDINQYKTVSDWLTVKGACSFILIRATVGDSIVDDNLDAAIDYCEQNYIPYWLYGVIQRDSSDADSEAEADVAFLTQTCNPKVSKKTQFVGYCIYLERNREIVAQTIPTEEDARLAVLYLGDSTKSGYSGKKMIYCEYYDYGNYKSVIETLGDSWAFWESRYGDNDGSKGLKSPDTACDLWQYTSNGKCDGILADVGLSYITDKGIENGKIMKWFSTPGTANVNVLFTQDSSGDWCYTKNDSVVTTKYGWVSGCITIDGNQNPEYRRWLVSAGKVLTQFSWDDGQAVNSDTERKTQYIGHRGLNTVCPENTVRSFMFAGAAGFWGCETDIRATSDGTIVCHHSATLNNTDSTDTEISSITYDVLKSISITEGSNYDSFKNDSYSTTIPTLDEYLSVCLNYDMVPVIEVKAEASVDISKLYSQIKSKMGTKTVWVLSFDIEILKTMYGYLQTGDNISLSHVVFTVDSSLFDTYKQYGMSVGTAYTDATQTVINNCHNSGIEIGAWYSIDTADTDLSASVTSLIENGIDYVTVNTKYWE